METGRLAFTAVYLKSNSGYIGFIEELPGVNSHGRTIDEDRAGVADLLGEHGGFGRGRRRGVRRGIGHRGGGRGLRRRYDLGRSGGRLTAARGSDDEDARQRDDKVQAGSHVG